jgi:HSP20 family molecular chaperone IbpA
MYFKTTLEDLINDSIETVNSLNAIGGKQVLFEEGKILLALPGFTKKDIDIQIEDRVLTVSSEVEEDGFRKSFSKRFKLSNTLDVDTASASMKDGVLTITFDKNEKSRKIVVK